MLLKSQDVSYCQLVRQFGTRSEIVSGVSFKGNLFIRGNSYPLPQKQAAITEMRRSYLDPEPAIACLLVDDGDLATIWYEDCHIVKVVESSQDIVKYYDLANLVLDMRSPNGVEIKDRARSFRLPHPRCFVGKEAVDWMVSNLALNRAESVALGQRLMDEKWLKNLSNDRPFADADFYYQFCMDNK